MRRRENPYKWLIVVLGILACIYILGTLKVDAVGADAFEQAVKIRCTCYVDKGVTADGSYTRSFIIAGKKEWLGCVACINKVNEDGTIGEFIGYYEFTDTGYGIETGLGESRIKKGKTLGSLETGDSVDIWQPTMHAAEKWIDTYGDFVYIKLIRSDG